MKHQIMVEGVLIVGEKLSTGTSLIPLEERGLSKNRNGIK
jgi:hypothetical protein